MIKPRKVVVTIELESGRSIKDLKAIFKEVELVGVVKQVQVNVIQDKK